MIRGFPGSSASKESTCNAGDLGSIPGLGRTPGDITLPTKVHLVKAMVSPVVMYGCESCTIKKAERQRIDAFELLD